ncbi:hypothetical protein GSI_08162 [Ganoderma sinense ZZ0214-1]|uniref:Uncharacterized protein n=1 Tax=Ganoderma sinense ZZ0214-1 TaxID=1077348 RepID=A0A2G8S7H5_9APHY|nr:hypothetical protein GSI_08162 [Ganoderma sinense ZZ0214-1]
MRFAVLAILAAAGLVASAPPCFHQEPSLCHTERARTDYHQIETPTAQSSVGSSFAFKFVDTTRNPGDTSHLQLGLWNISYRGDLGSVHFSTADHTTATATVSVPHQFHNGPYALVVQEIDNGNMIYQGDVIVEFSR